MTDEFDDQDFDFDDTDNMDEGAGEEPAEESSNRSFWIAVSVLGVVILLTLICLVAFFFISQNSGGGGRAAQQTEAAIAYAQQTQQAEAVAQTAEAAAWTSTPTITPTPTVTPTPTDVVAQATNTPEGGTPNPITQTVEALLTQAAQSTPLNTSTALPTQLPNTGVFDEMGGGGLVGLIGLALLAIVLIFFARRLRAASS
jgi:hypothetical protein